MIATASRVMEFTLLGPEGPIDPQITVAMSSKDSFATAQKDRLRLSLYHKNILTEGWVFSSTDVGLT